MACTAGWIDSQNCCTVDVGGVMRFLNYGSVNIDLIFTVSCYLCKVIKEFLILSVLVLTKQELPFNLIRSVFNPYYFSNRVCDPLYHYAFCIYSLP